MSLALPHVPCRVPQRNRLSIACTECYGSLFAQQGGWAPAMRACDSARDSRRSDSERHRPQVQPESIRAAPAGLSGLSRPQRCPAAGHAGGAPWAALAGHGPHDSDSSGRGRSERHRAGAGSGPSERAGSKRGARAAAAALAAASSPSAPPAATAPHPSNPSTPHHPGPRPTVAGQAPVRRASPAARRPAPDRVVRAKPEGRGPGVTPTLSRTARGPGVSDRPGGGAACAASGWHALRANGRMPQGALGMPREDARRHGRYGGLVWDAMVDWYGMLWYQALGYQHPIPECYGTRMIWYQHPCYGIRIGQHPWYGSAAWICTDSAAWSSSGPT